MNSDQRGPWYLLTGLLIGIVLGLVYAWVIQPVEYVDTPPASLRQDFKDRYRALIAAAFVSNQDLVRSQARLELLHDEDLFRILSEQAQRTLGENGSPDEARALGLLAVALGQPTPGPATSSLIKETEEATHVPPTGAFLSNPTNTPAETSTPIANLAFASEQTTTALAILSSTSPSQGLAGTPTATFKPKPSNTQAVSPTPTNASDASYVLLSQEEICEQKLSAPLFQVEAMDRFGVPVPGVLVIVSWNTGEERFYTGLKPEKGLGYADFTPSPGVVYAMRLGESGEAVVDLTTLSCKTTGGESYWGALLLRFVQP